jgi:hypothetical protein
MSAYYLIAHKVRGEPALDVAEQMECALCNQEGCDECDDCGYWWIIPTSGHRAYPYDYALLYIPELAVMPKDWTDHYIHNSPRKISLAESLGITKPKPSALPPIVRRM